MVKKNLKIGDTLERINEGFNCMKVGDLGVIRWLSIDNKMVMFENMNATFSTEQYKIAESKNKELEIEIW